MTFGHTELTGRMLRASTSGPGPEIIIIPVVVVLLVIIILWNYEPAACCLLPCRSKAQLGKLHKSKFFWCPCLRKYGNETGEVQHTFRPNTGAHLENRYGNKTAVALTTPAEIPASNYVVKEDQPKAKLKKLKEMFEEQLINAEDYEIKKKEILDSM